MNKRKAGEDFYFLHKIISLGSFRDLNSTTVYPSPRLSERVPFGTGRAMTEWMDSEDSTYYTYNPKSFRAIQPLFTGLEEIYSEKWDYNQFPECLRYFLEKESFEEHLQASRAKTTDYVSFKKRFYTWFNAFKMMKYLHYMRDHYFENVPVSTASKWLLTNHHKKAITSENPRDLLEIYRMLDKVKLKAAG